MTESNYGGKENITLPTTEQVILIAKEAGLILEGFFESKNFDIAPKSGGIDVLTEADTKVDVLVRKRLSEQFPNADILTEETSKGDYMHLKDSSDLWIVDPLDGSINFSRNNPHFGIAIGYVQKGNIKLAVAHLPMKDETYWAQESVEGAFFNGKKIQVSKTNDLKSMVISCDWSNNPEARKKLLDILGKVSSQTRRIKCSGSPVADLCLLARGNIDAYIHPRLRPWDVTPAYIAQKAGATVTTLENKAWNVFNLDILATNEALHNELSTLISL
ncbi:MAG: hypothetical protein A2857_00985 [Candidatus Levybacteria bacterium RIFCSPHIGHO2_01_FULL_36_15]|nr:MAG: hypothetical protein A2857_00985 [Candidatus Levybacteria bacterium RIFCSPHIGHO2_01_FULL_36_15]OGH38794.1 MAG: hypothetical protein A2905_02420 [Candidatus Levybacteria bacterium RIFCSPLOWO2_01_FULL_36_10]